MSLNRRESEDDWFDVGDASTMKSVRRAVTSPPTQSAVRFGSPPPALAGTSSNEPNSSARLQSQHRLQEGENPKGVRVEEEEEVISPTTMDGSPSDASSQEGKTSARKLAIGTKSPSSPVTDDSKVAASIEAPELPPTTVKPMVQTTHLSPSEMSPDTASPLLTRQPTDKPTSAAEQIPIEVPKTTLYVDEPSTVLETVTTPASNMDLTNSIASNHPALTDSVAVVSPSPKLPKDLASIVATAMAYVPPRVIAVLLGTWIGFKDSSNMLQFVKYCAKDHSILKTFIHCTVLNTIFILSLFTIVDLVAPLQPTGAFAVVWDTLFSLLWVVPMYAITQILGITWYEEIYRKCVHVRASERNRPTQPTRDVSFIGVSELVLKFLVTLMFGTLAALVGMALPRNFLAICGINIPIGFLISFAMSCWLHAFYCFDYRFLDQGRVDRGQSPESSFPSSQTAKLIPAKLSYLITIFERKWPYYLGYGASHIMVRTLMEWMEWPMFARMAVCSALFTVNVVTTVEASVRWEGDSTVGRLPIFTPFYKKLSEWVATANANRAKASKRDKGAIAQLAKKK